MSLGLLETSDHLHVSLGVKDHVAMDRWLSHMMASGPWDELCLMPLVGGGYDEEAGEEEVDGRLSLEDVGGNHRHQICRNLYRLPPVV